MTSTPGHHGRADASDEETRRAKKEGWQEEDGAGGAECVLQEAG